VPPSTPMPWPAMATATNGTFPYTYAWNSGGISSSEPGLCMGTYSVTVTDLNGCDTIMAIFIDEPTVLTAGGTMVAEKCGNMDGEATVAAGGGTAPYTYQWDDPGTQTTATAVGLSAQTTYNVIVTDTNGCTVTIPFTIPKITGPSIDTIVSTSLACAGDVNGIASVVVTGVSPPFTFAWDDPSTQSTNAASGLGAGTYSVTVTDLYGCDTSASITITEPTAIDINVSGTGTLCFGQVGGELNTVTTGGQGPYTYVWDNGLPATDSVTLSPTATATYNVTVTDSTGCTDTTSMEIVVGPALVASVVNDFICEGNNVTISVTASSGNGPPYAYLWSDGSTTSSITVTPTYDSIFTVQVSDGCSTPTNEAVVVTVGPKPIALFTAACNPNPFYPQFTDNSSIALGGSILSWNWNFDDGMTSTEQNPYHDYASSSTYSVSLTVTSADGCMDTYDSLIQSAPTASFTPIPLETTTANPNIEFIDGSS